MGKKKSIESFLLSHERALIRSGKLKILKSSAVADQSNSNDDEDFIRLYVLKEDDAENHEESDSEYDRNDYDDDSSRHENPLARTKCYRTMADAELLHLVTHNEMPSTLPFQTIFHGRPGLDYCACRLMGNDQNNKNKNSASAYGNATTVVEFDCDENFVDRLFSIQCKVLENEKDTAKKQDHDTVILTHSMGFRASRTLVLLNEALKRGDITWRIIMVKRPR